jgi:ATP-dependent DNA ligase
MSSTIRPLLFVPFPAGGKAKRIIIPPNEDGRNVYSKAENNFLHPKYDGWRIQLHHTRETTILYSSQGRDYTLEFGQYSQSIHEVLGNTEIILDIELVGYSSEGMHKPPHAILTDTTAHIGYALDILYLNGENLTELPTSKRVPLLQEFMEKYSKKNFRCAEYLVPSTQDSWLMFWAETVKNFHMGYDGVIINLANSTYFDQSIKVKQQETIDLAVVGAFLQKEAKEKNNVIDAVLLAAYSDIEGKWIAITRATENNKKEWNDIVAACIPHKADKIPLALKYPPETPNIWFDPVVVVEVRLVEWRKPNDYLIRPDRIAKIWLRRDKDAEQTTRFEEISDIDRSIQIHKSNRQLKLFDDEMFRD